VLPMDMLVVMFGGTRGTSRVKVGGDLHHGMQEQFRGCCEGNGLHPDD